MVHQVDSSSAAAPVVHLPPGLDAVEAMGRVEGYDSPDYDSADVEELHGSPPPRDQSFSAHYDELFELSTDSDDECDDTPLDSAEVRAHLEDAGVEVHPYGAVFDDVREAAAVGQAAEVVHHNHPWSLEVLKASGFRF